MACDGQNVSDSVSRWWWWYVALYVICLLVIAIGTLLPSDDVVGLIDLPYTLAIMITMSGLPLLAICLFVDAWKVTASTNNWNPNPYFYGVIGVIQGLFWFQGGFFPLLVSWNIWEVTYSVPPYVQITVAVVSSLVCVVYLFQRYRYVGFR